MKGVIVRFDAPTVNINGAKYGCLISPMELHAKCRRFMGTLIHLNPADEDQVLEVIKAGCDIADEALGTGSMAKIAAGKPVNLPGILSVLNTIMDANNSAYRNYIRKSYGGGR